MKKLFLLHAAKAALAALALSSLLPSAALCAKGSTADWQRPLKEQISTTIDQRLASRMGPLKPAQDRFFVTLFAYQGKFNPPDRSHTWATFVRIKPNGHREELTISWLPASFAKKHEVNAFSNFFARIFPSLNRCEPVKGKNYKLSETIAFAADTNATIAMWGPYEIEQPVFGAAKKRIAMLASGKIDYIADDRLYRKLALATNCMHAVSDLDEKPELSTFGSFLAGWLMPWGIPGAKNVVGHYEKKKWTIEPINPKKDMVTFKYIAPAREIGESACEAPQVSQTRAKRLESSAQRAPSGVDSRSIRAMHY